MAHRAARSSHSHLTTLNCPGNNQDFYLSSDRASDCCLAAFTGKRTGLAFAGKISRCQGNAPLPGATVTLRDSLPGAFLKEIKTGEDGGFNFMLASARPVRASVEKAGYFSSSLNIVRDKAIIGNLTADACLLPYETGAPIVLNNILFDFGSAVLTEESKETLDKLVKIIRDNPSARIEIAAHTDSVGNDANNWNLSAQRAASCVNYMIVQGIEQSRLTARGYGETRPIAPNSAGRKDNPQGRQLNRRIEFTVLKE